MRALSSLVFATLACAQTPVVVEGTVTNITTHGPIAGVQVSLEGPATYETVSDAAGSFHFAVLKPGDYIISYQSREFIGRGTRLHVAAGSDPVHVSMELEPLAKVQGRVVDGDGRPAARIQVRLLFVHGGPDVTATTDDKGRFSLQTVLPGRFVVAAIPKQQTREVDGVRVTWAPTYFPDAAVAKEAQVIRVGPGVDASELEIRLRAEPLFHLRGTVVDEHGDPAAQAQLTLVTPGIFDKTDSQVKAGDDGVFEFPAVRPGDWRLEVEMKRGPVTLKGTGSAIVSRRDLDGVRVRLSPPFALRGFVDRKEPRDDKGARRPTMVQLVPADGRSPSQGTGAVHEQDGSFTIGTVYPGRYKIQNGVVRGYYLESVKLGEREVIGQTVDIVDGLLPLRVTYRQGGGTVRGTVEGGCMQVFLLPQDDTLRDYQFLRQSGCGGNSRFEFVSLRPGDYYVVAFSQAALLAPMAMTDPNIVRQLIPLAERVHLENGGVATLQLKSVLWPE
jgi:hypothetical protein